MISNLQRFSIVVLAAVWLIVCLTGCTTTLRNRELEKVAKDWSLVIRASQVIPVYPLTEDLQPGDVLLVSTPIEDQVSIYKEKGFLPLDQHLKRLYYENFPGFYNHRYGIDDTVVPPKNWQTGSGEKKHNWEVAPHAAFPSYRFSVESGAGLNLAIPIQGIPFALGLMNSGKATGTVTIADAYTYGLDNASAVSLVNSWANQNRRMLSAYQPSQGTYHYLRVVTRVYAAGRINVTISNDEANSMDVAAGADRPVQLFGVKEGSSAENYLSAIKAINVLAESQLPGAKVKVASASSRSVTLNEEFSRPLVIGYVGFDIPILTGGRLGAPISTLSQLTGTPSVEVSGSAFSNYRIAALAHMHRALAETRGAKADEIRQKLDGLKDILPSQYSFTSYTFKSSTEIESDEVVVTGAPVTKAAFGSVLDYLAYAQNTVETLERYSGTRNDPELVKNLENATSALREMTERLNQRPELMEAIDFVFLGRS